MKNLSLLFFALVLFSFLACKDGNRPAGPASTETNVENPALERGEVEDAVAALNAALVDPERTVLKGMAADDLSYGHSSGNIQDGETFIDDLMNGPFDFLSIDTSDESIHISGSTAIARHVLSAKGTNEGEPAEVHIGIMLVFQKKNGKLRLLARQAYKL
ncbi:nuclear transport factor 2 family protein [Pricia sp. S334]|uniref:Nuclear transport factor 2 family protein n=1 Tax=Pricia mediterranea TaxID=3076079 RepID=A0ABU3L5C1_9FLAO|nr:nuclear transport factor 2 family protein [Pricia sp. S334]MDT7828647.1 nuclear transport factor 2 family protein [Pricia sp. S334]